MTREALLLGLRGPPAEAVAAAEALGAMGDRTAVGALANALRSVHGEVRSAACEALGVLGDPRAVGPLVSLLRDPDEGVRGEAFSALLAIGQARAGELPVDRFLGEDLLAPSEALTQVAWPTDLEAIAVLIHALEDADPEVRIGAGYTLGRLGLAGTAERLMARLADDPDADVRAAMAFGLGELLPTGARDVHAALVAAWYKAGASDELAVQIVRALADTPLPAAHDVLAEALRHKDERVRQLGAMGLGRLHDPTTIPRLARALNDPHRGVRRVAAAALGELGDLMALKPLVQAVVGNDAEVRSTIARALERLNPEAVRTHLVECLMTPDAALREAAAYLLGRLGHVAGLRRALRDPDEHVRKAGALAIGNCADPEYRTDLETALDDPSWPVRVAAAEGLRRMADGQAVPALLRHREDPHRVVRNAVALALRTLGNDDR